MPTLSRRRFASLGASAAGAAVLAACGYAPWSAAPKAAAQDPTPVPTPDVATSGQGDVKLNFVSVVGTSTPFGQARLRVLDKFTAANPGVTVNYEAIPYDGFFSQLVTRALAGDAPEIAQDGHHTAQFAVNDTLVAFDDYMARDGIAKENYWPALWQLGDFAGKSYSMPFTIDTRFTYSNQALYDTMGIAVPDTWDQMLAAGDAAKAQGLEAAFGLTMGSEVGGLWETGSNLAKTNGGVLLTLNEDGTATSNLSSTAVVETVEFLTELVAKQVVPEGSLALQGSELESLFKTNQMASFCSGNWMLANFDQALENGDMDFTPVATHLPMKLQRGASAGGWGWYVFKTIDDPDLGWNLVKFFLEDDNVNEGWPDSLPPGSAQLGLPYYADDPRNQFVAEVLGYASWPIEPVAGYFEVLPIMWRAMATAINGQASAADAMKSGDEEVQRLLDSGHNMMVGA
ncbi:MAG: extracellular solute-binding protein [Thermomicrobiales bacterium]|nr:extracellular solute-binding protein [Thermomicrobiales bacterium]